MRQIFQYESLEWLLHLGIVSNVVWCDLEGEATPTSFTSYTIKGYCGTQQALLE